MLSIVAAVTGKWRLLKIVPNYLKDRLTDTKVNSDSLTADFTCQHFSHMNWQTDEQNWSRTIERL